MELQDLLERLTGVYPKLSPQLQQAAKHVLAAPEDVAVHSMRWLANQADVTPTTLIRLARTLDFEGYEAFRLPFREAVRAKGNGLVKRAEWLRELGKGGATEKVIQGMAEASLENLAEVFRATTPANLKNASKLVARARNTYIAGVGASHIVGAYFQFVANMMLPNVIVADTLSGSGIDDLCHIGARDVLMTFCLEPYARATVDTVEFARSREAKLISFTDSRTSPTAAGAAALFIVPTASPQFFPSYVATMALLETIMALIVAGGGKKTVTRISEIEQFRKEQGLYWSAD